ncbi:flagellar filament capping protein FliD [Paenibacillus sp. y28]|uniref:flagellar filament capping protein FliD n=1 Tax=Paenibacillus sp. y28 TaxID=3129110 RepID=UPI0030163479
MVTRITGLSSGMDIDGLISKLMTAEREPLNKLNRKQQSLTWKTDAYRTINTKISSFRSSFSTLRFGSSWTQTAATSSDTTKVTVTTGSTATAGTHNIVVSDLAKAGSLYSSGQISDSSLISDGTVDSYAINETSKNNKLSVTLGGVTRTVTIADGSYSSASDIGTALQSAIDTAFGANQIKVDTTSGSIELKPLGATGFEPQLSVKEVSGYTGVSNLGFTEGQAFKFDASAKLSTQADKLTSALSSGSFTINGQTITFDPSTDSLNSIISNVNNSSAGVKMSYDSTTDRISFTTKSTGENAAIDITNDTSGFTAAFKLAKVSDGSGGYTNYSAGTSASVKIDGIEAKYATNSFTQNGITYNLQNVTDSSGVNITSSIDTDGIYKKVEEFVSQYNDVLSSINSLLSETKYRSYQPLTSDEKSAMSDSDIELWETKAKSGLLKSDTLLSSFRTSIRETVYSSVSTVTSDKNSLYSIGVTTGQYVRGDTANLGKLEIDSDKLKAAIEEDPQAVINMLTSQTSRDESSTTDPAIKRQIRSEKGIFQRLYESADSVISSITKAAGTTTNGYDNVAYSLGKQIHDIENQIDVWEDKLVKKEDRYYTMFSAMEKAISKGNSQLSALQSFMS